MKIGSLVQMNGMGVILVVLFNDGGLDQAKTSSAYKSTLIFFFRYIGVQTQVYTHSITGT